MVKMKVNKNKNSRCDECNTLYKNTPEMYDLLLCGEIFTLCKDCVDVLFQKTLKASCMYNGKIKQKEDMQRLMNNSKLKEKENVDKNTDKRRKRN